MTGEKAFDCVEMKAKIQEELLREEQELGPEEAKRRQWQRALNDPILGPLLAKLTAQDRGRKRQELTR